MKYQSILFKGMAVIASLSLACSCNTRLHEPDPAEGSLSILPSIEGATLTKATEPGDDDQRENTVVKLDVFVNGEFSDNTSWRVYHLDATKDRIEEGVNTLLNQLYCWQNLQCLCSRQQPEDTVSGSCRPDLDGCPAELDPLGFRSGRGFRRRTKEALLAGRHRQSGMAEHPQILCQDHA